MIVLLRAAARQGRVMLIAGIVAGLLLPDMAAVLRPWVGEMVAALLLITGMRVGARAAFGTLRDISPALRRVVALQLALPVMALGAFGALGWLDRPLPLALSLMLAAPSLTGAPNFAAMAGHDPAPGMRLLVLSTALFPVTALPAFWVLDPLGTGVPGALHLSGTLIAAILGAAAMGFGLRAVWPALGQPGAQQALDGAAALLLAVVVVGLMAAVGPLLIAAPLTLLGWIAVALTVNFGLHLGTLWACRQARWGTAVATSIYAGNRNIALFLIVLPDAVAAPLMIFVGCYQIPMYLTPWLVARLHTGP